MLAGVVDGFHYCGCVGELLNTTNCCVLLEYADLSTTQFAYHHQKLLYLEKRNFTREKSIESTAFGK
jgi:hypothetical protein